MHSHLTVEPDNPVVLVYGITLSILSIITWYTVDPDVWIRDPTGSPSLFPARLIFETIKVRYGLEARTSASQNIHRSSRADLAMRFQSPTSPVTIAGRSGVFEV